MILRTALAASFLFFSVLHADEVDLRGYGKVTATVAADHSDFTCENPAQADILLGKLLADMFWDAGGAQVDSTVDMGGRKVVIHEWQPYGAIIVGRTGSRVHTLGGKDAASLAAAAKDVAWITDPATRFAPAAPYPAYLDFFDLRAFKAYNHSLNMESILDTRWDFARQFLPGGLSIQHPAFREQPADGVVNWDGFDLDFAQARRQGILYTAAVSTGVWPRWAVNLHPDWTRQLSPLSTDDEAFNWYTGEGESYGLTPAQRQATSLAFMKDVLLRYKDNPMLGGIQLYCSDYFFETGFNPVSNAFYDYSPVGQAAFRRWLRQSYSLADLGGRWYGDPSHFQSWDEVMIPGNLAAFFGDLGPASFSMSGPWSWQKAPDASAPIPAPDAPGWIPLEWSPSQERKFLPEDDLIYHVSFDPGTWLAKNSGRDVWLSCRASIHRKPPGVSVWLNGHLLGEYVSDSKANAGSFAVKMSGPWQAGKNDLVFRVPAPGRLFGPVFLTTEAPVSYPYLGKNRNAQYVDMLRWQLASINDKVSGAMEYARHFEPDRPFIIPVGSAAPTGAAQADACATYGSGLQMTGREAWYHPWWPRMGYIDGFYGTSEPSAPVKDEPHLDRLLGWIMQDGDGSHMLFWDVASYIDMEKQNGWFTRHRRLLQLFGKYLPQNPQIVILRSSLSALLTSDVMDWDIGRGEIQSAHYDNLYASEDMLARGLVDKYPVLFDTNTQVMSPETIAAIRHYVEQGGTFVALNNTGRHTLLETDDWPISELTGFKITAVGKKGTIQFENSLPLFKGWEGKQFDGSGTALGYDLADTAKDAGVALQPANPDTTVLAKWDDGSVAVGMRKLGRGRIIVLGSTFWRSGKDDSGIWVNSSEIESAFLERLFTDLGVARNATATNPAEWTRTMVTKNGLQEWLVAFNSTATDLTCDVGFAAAQKPDEVWDMIEQKPVPFDYADGMITVKGVDCPGYSTHVYGIRNTSLSGGVATWWGEKTKFWKRPKLAPLSDDVVTRGPDQRNAVQFSDWKFLADRDNSVSASPAWQQSGFDDQAWLSLKTGPWTYQDDSLKDFRGTGLYRSLPFTVPAAWAGRPVSLRFLHSEGPTYLEHAVFYLNGVQVAEYDARSPGRMPQWDITGKLKDGANILAVQVTGTKDWCGLTGTFWIQPDRTFAPVMPLHDGWQAVADDYLTRTSVTVPGKVQAKYLTRDVDVPAAWKGKNVYLTIDMPTESLERLMINGQPAWLYNAREEINLTPYLKFGDKNELQLWAKPGKEGAMAGPFQIDDIALGCESTP